MVEGSHELPHVLLMENVPDVIGEKNIKDFQMWQKKLELLGYTNYVQLLNAKDFGIPQNRNRCFMLSILGDYYYKFPQKKPLEKRLKDLLEPVVDEKYYLSERMMNYILDTNDVQKGTKWEGRAENDSLNPEIAHTISVRGAGGHQRAGVSNFIIDDFEGEIKVKDIKARLRKMTEERDG